MAEDLDARPRVAYFSMEIAIAPAIPTYSGGLGVLAGDLLRSASDLGLPFVGVTLVSRLGYLRQDIVDGAQRESRQPWNPAEHAVRVPVKVPVRIGAADVWVGAWRYDIASPCCDGMPVPVLLLDTDLPENEPADRRLTDELYGGDDRYRLKQEMVLGIGGVRLLQALGVEVSKYHLNEGHAAFLALQLLAQHPGHAQGNGSWGAAIAAVRKRCVFTTHTPVRAAMDQFDYGEALACLDGLVDAQLLRSVAGETRLNMTFLALNLSGWVNGVAQRHAQVSRGLYPGYTVHAITNGVHARTWASDRHQALYDRHVPQWRHEPERLMEAMRIPEAEILEAHRGAKADLVAEALASSAPGAALLRPERLTVGYARRMTGYKRPHLLFHDLERLRRIAGRFPLQVVIAGKAHPHDREGKEQIARIHAWARQLAPDLPVVFLPDYDMRIARRMVAGCDVWLNTPQPPLEASGTSGMKAAVNGVPSLSVLDGWWLEGWIEGATGWAVGDDGGSDDRADAQSLYDKLETAVGPLYYENPRGWADLMRNVIARNGAFFNSHRMLRRYVLEAYTR